MFLAVTILCGVFLGWAAGREGVLAVVPPTVVVAGALTLAGYLRFLFKNWRMTLRRFSTHGSRTFQREAVRTLGWSLIFRLLVMAAAGLLAYWISVVVH
jgi:hypothetical protein